MLSIFGSVNKVALGIFFVIIGLIIYEIIQITKRGTKKNVLVIPDFEYTDQHIDFTPLKLNPAQVDDQPSSLPVHTIILGFLFVILVSTLAFLIITRNTNQSMQTDPTRTIQVVESQGIYVYDSTWTEIPDSSPILPGDYIYIGIKTIPEVSSDKARIRVNQDFWSVDDETSTYNSDHDVYYVQYYVPQDKTELDIDAQLHTKKEAWLTE